MKIIVFGATGGVGSLILPMAVQAGHDVTAFVRSPEKVTTPGVNIIAGDAFDAAAVRSAIAGHDVVVSALGSTAGPDKHTSLQTMGTNIANALEGSGVSRVVWCASSGVDGEMTGVAGKLVMKMLAKPLADHRAALASLRATGIDLTVARPGSLKDAPLATDYVETPEGPNVIGAHEISRASVAHFMVKALDDPAYANTSVALGRRK